MGTVSYTQIVIDMRTQWVVVLLVALLGVGGRAGPQRGRVHFETEESARKCEHFTELYWEQEGKCYTAGEKGPCKDGEIFKVIKGKPGCGNVVEETHANIVLEAEEECESDKIPFQGGCYHLASTGPCNPGEWLVLLSVTEEGVPEIQCQPRKCPETQIYWGQDCTCLKPSVNSGDLDDETRVCGEGGEVLVSPYGEGVCGCRHGWEVGRTPQGHQGANQGVCRRKSLQTRGIFDNIPVNDESQIRRATQLNCYVDEDGNCRVPFDFGPGARFGLNMEDWLDTFQKPNDVCPLEPEENSETA